MRSLAIGELRRQAIGEALVDPRVLGVTAVGIPAREARIDAEVLVAADAEPARTAGSAQPCHADALPEPEPFASDAKPIDDADDLVTWHYPRPVRRNVSIEEVEVGPANATRQDAEPDLTG